MSGWKEVINGVPQGLVPMAFVFLTYINDVMEAVNSNGSLFADDAKIKRRGEQRAARNSRET